MNYQAFTDDSLRVMYETVRGALASDDALAGSANRLDSGSVKPRNGSYMPQISSRKCSGAARSSKRWNGWTSRLKI
jgi:hypothetical protein